MITGFSVHRDRTEAERRGEGFRFFRHALGHHYIFGEHTPGRISVWDDFQATEIDNSQGVGRGIGTPDDLRAHIKGFEDAGVDHVAFIQQGGKNRHEHICEALELFAAEVMPEFHEREAERQRRRDEELAPYIEKAMARKVRMPELADADIPRFTALGKLGGVIPTIQE